VTVTVHLPGVLRAHAGGAADISVEDAGDDEGRTTVRSLLDHLGREHPALVRRIVDERGELRRFVNVYVGDVDVRDRDGLATTIPDGSTVLVLPSVAGG
jgi:molybdopterin converting factor small subunit